jgi:hypothetical protein
MDTEEMEIEELEAMEAPDGWTFAIGAVSGGIAVVGATLLGMWLGT